VADVDLAIGVALEVLAGARRRRPIHGPAALRLDDVAVS
jgi:hypothetical protein